MKKIKLYLDNCCFNRPYDNQEYISVKLETEAKLSIQMKIKERNADLCWSYILDFENENNPFTERRNEIIKWKKLAISDIDETPEILTRMNSIMLAGIKALDALHISCAIASGCDYFLTVDKGILKKAGLVKDICIVSPIEYIMNEGEEYYD